MPTLSHAVRPTGARGWERLAERAAELFHAHGHAGVGLRTIAESLGIQAASLYHHFPGGKDELFVRAIAYSLDRYRSGLERAAREPAEDLATTLSAMADWMLDQPPIDTHRLLTVDIPRLRDRRRAHDLTLQLRRAIEVPFVEALSAAQRLGQASRRIRPRVIAASVVAVIVHLGFRPAASVRSAPIPPAELERQRAAVHHAIAVIARGLRPGAGVPADDGVPSAPA